MKCRCRNCHQTYDNRKSRAEYTGYCTAKCLHDKARQLGYRKGKGRSEYDVLNSHKALGDLPVALEELQALFKVKPKLADDKKSWFLRIGPITLAEHETALMKIPEIVLEWHYKHGDGDDARWHPVPNRKDANAVIVRVKKGAY